MINEETLNIQHANAPSLKKEHIHHAVALAEETVMAMASLSHIEKGDKRTVSSKAQEYWRSYFGYNTLADDKIGAGFGYDLRQWRDKEPNSTIPSWRIYLYLWHPPKVIHDFSAVRDFCKAREGWWDEYADNVPVDESKPDKLLWLPVPKEFVRGLNEATPSANTPLLLAGAVNAFLGNLLQ